MRIISRLNLLISAVLAVAVAPGLLAQDAGDEQGFQQTVARVSAVAGDASFQRGDDPDHWQPVGINVPMTIGDRLYSTAAGRVELEAPGLRAFVAPETELTILNLTEDVQQYSMAQGTATFRVSHMDDEDAFEIDTPNAAIALEATGLYRVFVDADGNTRVSVRRGEARVSAGGGEVTLRTGEAMHIDGVDEPEYDVFAMPLADSWDRWVDSRERPRRSIVSYDFASEDILGASDLDSYGRWEETPEYGHVWFPANVAEDWAPYRAGHWMWQDPWGWTWVSSEPWGWAPYHYGRWAMRASRWCWVPVAPNVRHVAYAPALVGFVGGGPGWSVSISAGGGFIGWFPLGPRDPLVPWWGSRALRPVSVANVTYVNRSHVTIVDRGAFVSARPVQAALVRDSGVLKQVASQPVVRGPLPVLPIPESIRGPSPGRVAARPLQRIVERPVAARLAPPPAPPVFSEKLRAIRENRGAPMTPAGAAKLVTESPQGARAAVPIRPVAREGGHVELAPRRDALGAPPPDPIRAGGRTMSSPQTPFISHPSGSRESVPPMRVAPGAVTTPVAKPAAPPSQPTRAVQGVPPGRRLENEPGRPVVISPPARPTPAAEPAPRRVEQARPPQVEQVHPGPGRPPQVEQAHPAPQVQPAPQPERRELSRAPRRVAPSGPDPLQSHGTPKDDKGDKDKKEKK